MVNNVGEYHHHIQSLHIVDNIAKDGKGLNLSLQVRDGILSHDGEVHDQILRPVPNKTNDDLNRYIQVRKEGKEIEMMPMTIEGCVVRISDTIAYIGQDIEDAIRIGLIRRSDIPEDLRKSLGSTNGEIIDTLVKDVVYHSMNRPYISFGKEVSDQLLRLKDFNYQNIYLNSGLKREDEKIKRGFAILFEIFLNDLKNDKKESKIFKHFLNTKNKLYLEKYNHAEKVRDFIGGMTDRYFVETLKEMVIPHIELQMDK